MRFSLYLILILTLCAIPFAAEGHAELITFDNPWGDPGFNLVSQGMSGVEVVFSIENLMITEIEIDGIPMKNVQIPGAFLPNNSGAPNLPGDGRGIAIPRGAAAILTILDSETEVIENIDIAPAPPIPLETDDSPLAYEKDPSIYNLNDYYPTSPVLLSEPKKLRGVDFVTLGITPFQYNPVSKQLVVFKNIRVEVKFEGGYGHIGEDRLRNIHWEPVLKQNLINYESLPEIDFSERYINPTDVEDVEYLIIVPDDPVFIEWADTIKNWRSKQGISTGVVTLSEIGGNSSDLIEDYINEAYNTWSVPPAAFLLLSDYQNSGLTYGLDSPIWSSYCVSDNIYADVDGDELPDIAHSRMTAQNATHLETMVTKFLEYERNPPTDPNFYQHPVTAGGWQTERWFILCTEICWGFMHNILEKDPVREYAIYSGTPGTVWSTNPNTYMLVNYFGPNGLGYIPETPEHLDDWGGNANRLNQDLNDGAFMLMHRDHGGETGWGEPDYDIGDLGGLINEMLPFVFSINCLTGKYNSASACFAEEIHRMEHGALGIIAASEVSYSFVNDTYMLGLMDYLWSSFDPSYGQPSEPTLNPCFANVSGKWYLFFKDWPYNPQNKVVTYHLFHHHGDSYNTMFYDVPSYLDVSHSNVLFSGSDYFTVTANSGALIGLTVDNEIIGVGIGTGAPQNIPIIPQTPGVTMTVTVTKANFYRYEQSVDIIPPDGWGIAEGYITDGESGDPLSGIVSVTNREPLLTTQAGSDGFYSLWIPADSSWNLRAEYGENYLPSFADVTVSEDDTIQQDFQLELKVEVILKASFGNPDDINYRRFYARGSWDEDGFYNEDWNCPFREMNDTGLGHDEVAGDGIFTGSVLLAVDLDHDYDWGVFFENYNDMHSFLQMGDDFGVTDPGNPPVVQTLEVNPSGGEHNWTLTVQGTNNLLLDLLPGYEGIDYKWAGSVTLDAGTTYDFCVYPMHFYEPFYGHGGPGGDDFTITPNYTEDVTIIFSDNTDEIDYTSAHPRPGDIQATLDMDDRIDISWGAPDVTPDGYKIYRSLYETGPFDSTGYTSHPTVTFSDMRVENYRDYWYYITAIYPGDIESIPSEIVYGYAITGARLSVLPESFEVNVYPGSTLTANLLISNPGGLPLEYQISTGVESRLFDLPDSPEEELSNRLTIPDYDKTMMKPGYHNPPQPFDAGGPDAFGYAWIDSDEPGGPPFNWIDISETGTQVSFSDPDDGNSLELPLGFDFEYYGNAFDGINLCTNGWASFTDSTCVEYGNMPIPHPEPPNNMLAVFYDDMNLENGGEVYFYTNNSDTAIASYINIPDWRQEGTFTFQIILVAPAKIYFQYLSLGPGRMDENSIGIEDEDGLIGLQVASDQIYAHDSLTISFYKHWLAANPESGIVQPDLADTISIGFDATTLDEGDYTGTIDITGWDIYHQEDPVSIAVTMHVTTQTNAPGEEDLPLPVNYALHQNYPNPFNPTTTIKYELPDAADVKLEIFNLLGQRVETLVDRKHQAGRYSINWHADNQPSGIYFYRLKTDNKTISRKMLLLK